MLRIQICVEMSGDFFVLDMSGDSWNIFFKHFCSIFLGSQMCFKHFCAFVPNLVKIGARAGGRDPSKRTKLVRILGVISDLPGIAQASSRRRSGNRNFGRDSIN